MQQLITEYHSTHSVSTSAGASSGSGGGGGDLSSNKAFMKTGVGSTSGLNNRMTRTGIIPQALGSAASSSINPYDSGKFVVVYRLMLTMRVYTPHDRIVLISNYTSTLDLLERMCV